MSIPPKLITDNFSEVSHNAIQKITGMIPDKTTSVISGITIRFRIIE